MKHVFFLAVGCLLATCAFAKNRPSKFGHFPFREAPANTLSDVGVSRSNGRPVKLQREAAQAFLKLTEAARQEEIRIVPLSGFRTVEYQKGLFRRSTQKHGSARAAARWVAPPGHSEHHTGWALDLGAADRPETDVEPSFENTKAFGWLRENASRFGFELSFPKDNPQGVSYEPWHWRFVGNAEARRAFHPEEPSR